MKTELVTTLKRDVEDFDFMQQRIEILEGIARGENAILEGYTYSQVEAKKAMNKWLRKNS